MLLDTCGFKMARKRTVAPTQPTEEGAEEEVRYNTKNERERE
jgi:hypothetical protein